MRDRGKSTVSRIALLLPVVLLAVLLQIGPAFAITPFTNSAALSSAGSVISSTSVTAFLDAPTPSSITFYQYAPTAPDAIPMMVPTTSSSNDGSTSGGTQTLNQIYAVGSSTPIDLSNPVPLVSAITYHQNEPIFIEVADGDQNQDPSVADTVWVLLSVVAIGESELLLLTETAPSSGIFCGYIQSTGSGTATTFDGVLHVSAAEPLVGEYVDRVDASDRVTASVLVDPYGIVFDSSTGNPLDGVGLTLINAATGQPATVFGDDGISSFPSTITSGGTATDSSGKTYPFPPGEFRFPFVATGDYRFDIAAPNGYGAPSVVPTAVLQALPGGPFAIREPGSRGEVFTINPGPSINLDIPVDPLAGTLWLRKTASTDTVAVGDFLQYILDLENTDADSADGVVIVDRLPLGFRYQNGSARQDGRRIVNPQTSADGRTLSFNLSNLAAGVTTQVRYVVEVAAGARPGEAVNTAMAGDNAGNSSNAASATVRVKEDLFRSENIIVGRVIADNCDDAATDAADGVQGVRLYMEDGTFVITDEQGMYHFEGVPKGVHVVQLDVDSLPDTAEVFACEMNTRFAGSPWSQFVDLQGGTLWRADFHVKRKPGLDPAMPAVGKDLKPVCSNPDAAGEAAPADTAVAAEATIGILAPADGSRLTHPINAVRVRLDAGLKPRLLLDGNEISDKRIGFTLKDPASTTTLYSYIGVDFGAAGRHTLEIQGIGPFGNARFKQTLTVVRTGQIAAIRLRSAGDNVADGKTPVTLTLELLDGDGQAIQAPAELEIRDGNLKACPSGGDMLSRQAPDKIKTVHVAPDGRVSFAPVTASGRYQVSLGYNDARVDAEIFVKPYLREWIIVGLAEGTAGYNTVSGNMESLADADEEEKFYQDGRMAFFAKGKVRGKWLLTLAYDSEKDRQDPSNPLFQTIDPDSYYTLYGDNTTQQYDAASIRKLYVKLEREEFYLLFGDYDTGLTVTELSKYSRTLNGLKTEFAGQTFSFNGFATDTRQAFVKDEIRGDGTSGLYRLTRKNILLNSEKVTIETRDRYKSEVILSTQPMARYVDYSIDYDAGTLFFKSPVYSRDGGFNPITIVVEYESDDKTDESYTYGGRGAVRMLDDRVEVGGTYIHEGPVNADGDLGGADLTVKLDEKSTFKAEVAATRREETGQVLRDNAWLAEVVRTSEKLDTRLYAREQGEDFGLGQQNGSESGTRKIGAEADYRVNQTLTLSTDLYRQSDLSTDSERDMGEGRATYDDGDYRLYSGLRLAEDRLGDGSVDRSNMLLAGAGRSYYGDRLLLRLDHEQLLSGDNSSAYPTRTLAGADFRLTDAVSLFGEQELTWGSDEDTQSTRAGVKATPWSGGQLGTSVGRETTDASQRVFANLGLNQTWQINDRWSLDGGFERSHTIEASGDSSLDSFADGDFTALSLGAGYRADVWSWTSRAETRFADDEEKWNLLGGFIVEPIRGLGLSAGVQLNITDSELGQDDTAGDIRLSLAWRPKNTRWIVLDRLDFKFDRFDGSGIDTDSRRIVNNLNLNYKPDHRLQLALQYGAKYVLDTIDDDTYTGFTDLVGLEARFDITQHWDVGVRGSVLHSWNAGQMEYSTGASVGYAIVKNAWLSVGYNFTGFEDEDFSLGSYTAKGPFVQFRLKFDQQTVRDMVDWFGGKTR